MTQNKKPKAYVPCPMVANQGSFGSKQLCMQGDKMQLCFRLYNNLALWEINGCVTLIGQFNPV